MDYWVSDISTFRTDIQLIFLSFAAGVIDAFSIIELGVFSSNQTGNTIFLAISAAQAQSSIVIQWSKNLVAIMVFWAAAFATGQLSYRVGPCKRWWLVSSHMISSLLLYIAAVLLYTGAVDIAKNQNNLVFITLTGVSFGIQAMTVRPLNVPEIPTVVITMASVDLWSDKDLFKQHNLKRNRRAAFIIVLFFGAVCGSLLTKVSVASAVILAASIKLAIALSFMLNANKISAKNELTVNP